ncbi:class I SAM-dependent methyltransferase [Haloarchaeobius sp. DFWS5]|uniref:class I SAM-dependent methyltransferase n=1 Tax=Haloarchaeobius sp. DFWS5 TaxID=3446114 RepID=UPI003EBD944B
MIEFPDVHAMYDRLPSRFQPVVQKWYYRVDPRLSWTDRKKKQDTEEAFIQRFFDGYEEFLAYRDEFDHGRIPPAIGDALQQLDGDKRLFDSHLEECQKAYAYVRKYEPDVLVETGVYNGVSTASLLYALDQNGHGTLYSIDPSPHLRTMSDDDPAFERWRRTRPSCSEEGSARCPSSRQPGWLIPEDLHEHWELSFGRSREELPALLDSIGEVDLFYHDSDHSSATMEFEFELAWEYLSSGGILLSNHVGWNETFETFTADRTDDCGLVTWHYNPRRNYPTPGSAGYAVKHGGSPSVATATPEPLRSDSHS